MTTARIVPFRTFTDEPQYVNHTNRQPAVPKPLIPEKIKPVIVEALPWQELPEGYTDYRPLLQRDGLILFAWEIWEDMIKVVWLASNGNMRKYQAWADNEKELETIRPERKYDYGRYSYSEKGPDFIIYAAPAGLTVNTRDAFIAKLQSIGVSVNFNYSYSISRQKAEMEGAILNRLSERSLNSEETELLEGYRQLSSEEKIIVIEYLKSLLNNQKGVMAY
jgi:hypothetical protein